MIHTKLHVGGKNWLRCAKEDNSNCSMWGATTEFKDLGFAVSWGIVPCVEDI